jgi:signal transduction histidine kinase
MGRRSEFRQPIRSRSEVSKLKKDLEQLKEERRHTAERLAGSMRLAALGQLAAGVAHELNNPLSAILGFAQSLRRQFDRHESLQASLKTIEREALRCRRLVQDLLDFSRLHEPRKVMEDVIQVLEGALPLVEAQARIQHVELIRDFAEGLPPVCLDRSRIQQMIINLCTNAIDAMPRGGRLTIRARLVPGPKGSPSVEIRVSDTGTGIPLEIQDRIFEPFFTTKDPGRGTGLGLSLVQDVVKEHGAELDLISESGLGTTFFVRLPVVTPHHSPGPTETTSQGAILDGQAKRNSTGPGRARSGAL